MRFAEERGHIGADRAGQLTQFAVRIVPQQIAIAAEIRQAQRAQAPEQAPLHQLVLVFAERDAAMLQHEGRRRYWKSTWPNTDPLRRRGVCHVASSVPDHCEACTLRIPSSTPVTGSPLGGPAAGARRFGGVATRRVAHSGEDRFGFRREALRRRAGARRASCAAASLSVKEGRPAGSARRACSCSDGAAAAASSTSAAFCCVTSSICVTAWLTCSMPAVCSWLAAAISPMMSVTRFTAVDDLVHRLAGLLTSLPPRSTFSHRVADQRLDLLGGRGRALRQVAHLGGHHREAAALLAGARRFHRRVQRQDVGLERDAVDHADDVDDLAWTTR